jgi:hypothetical protein
MPSCSDRLACQKAYIRMYAVVYEVCNELGKSAAPGRHGLLSRPVHCRLKLTCCQNAACCASHASQQPLLHLRSWLLLAKEPDSDCCTKHPCQAYALAQQPTASPFERLLAHN